MKNLNWKRGFIVPLRCGILGFVFFALSVGQVVAQNTYVYVGNYNGNSLSGYLSDPANGMLSAVPGSPFPTGSNPIWVALDQKCRFAYTPNQSGDNISGYKIDTNTGQAVQVAGSPFAAGVNPAYSELDRTGKFLFVPISNGESGTTVSVFSVDQSSGALTEVAGSPFTTGGITPTAAFIDPSNRFLYVVNDGPSLGSPGLVSGFTINPNTGFLTPIPGSPWSTNGSNPRDVISDNTGKFLYVSNVVSGNVEIFTIDSGTGALTQAGSVSVGFNIYRLVIDASNQFAYLGQIGTGVYGFSRETTTGMLTALPGFPISTESPQDNPGLAVDPVRPVLYVNNHNTSTVNVYSIGTSGSLTQTAGPYPSGPGPYSIAACTAGPNYAAQIQQPINGDGSSVFSATKGVVPVKFTLTVNGAATCDLPPATISLSRTGGGTVGPIDENVYQMSADSGSNYRIDSTACQYVYNLAAKSLGVGTYQVKININNSAVGNGTFGLQ